jgi:hypothetical protein
MPSDRLRTPFASDDTLSSTLQQPHVSPCLGLTGVLGCGMMAQAPGQNPGGSWRGKDLGTAITPKEGRIG